MVKTYSEYKGFRPGDKVKVRPSCASGITLKPEFVYTVSRISEGETNPRGYVYLVESSECWNPERFEKVEGVVVSSPARSGNKLNEVGERIVPYSFATGGIVTSYTTTTNVLPNQYYEKAIKLILEQQSLLPNIFADPGKQKNEELEAEPEVPQKKLIRKVRFDLVNA